MTAKNKALALSFLRVLLGCFITAYTAVAGADAPWSLTAEEWQKIGNALWGATLVTVVNYFRSGETRFGRGSKDMGMGGDDTVAPPDGQIITPDGPVDPPQEAFVEEQTMPVLAPDPDAREFAEDEKRISEEQTIQGFKSTPLEEVRAAARKAPAKKAAVKKAPAKKAQKPL